MADSFANLRRVLPDAGREHEPVDTAERRRERANLLGGLIHEVVHRESRVRLAAVEQVAHVVADAGNAEQPRLLVEDRFEILRREPDRLDEMEDHARVDRSRPGPHAETVERGEAERAVDALQVLHRAEAGAAAQVRDDHAAVRDLGRHVRQHGRDVLVREPVKTISLHAAAAQVARQRHHLGDGGLPAMKAGIEAGDLRHARQSLGHGVDGGEVVRLMKRRQRHERAQVREDFRRDDRGPRVLRAAVHDAMTDAEHARVAAIARAEPRGERIEGAAPVQPLRQAIVGHARVAAILRRESRRRADAVDLPAQVHAPERG